MEIRYACSYWGQEGVSPSLFLSRVIEAGFDGVDEETACVPRCAKARFHQ